MLAVRGTLPADGGNVVANSAVAVAVVVVENWMSALMKQTRQSVCREHAAGRRSPTVRCNLIRHCRVFVRRRLAPNSLRASSAGDVDSRLNLLVLPAACLDAARPPDNSPIWHRRRRLKSNYRRVASLPVSGDVDMVVVVVCSFLHSMSFA